MLSKFFAPRLLNACLLGVLLLAGSALSAQLSVTLGNPAALSNNFPWNGTSFRFQTAYAQADLQLPAGALISEIRVFGSIVAIPTYNNLRCRLAHAAPGVAVNAMLTTFDLNWTAASVVTCLGPVNYTPTTVAGVGGQWYVFTLTTPFVYNATDHLVVDWSYDSKVGTGWTVATAIPAAPPEQPRSRLYSSGGNFTTVTGTSSANEGHYGVQFFYLPPGNANIISNQTAATAVQASGTDVVLLNLNATVFTSNQTLNSIMFTKTGTAANAAISQLKLVRDNNNNGVVEGTDTVLGTGNLTGNTITFTGAPLQALTASVAVRLLLAATYSGAAFYSTMDFQVASAASVVWSGGTDLTGYPLNSGARMVDPPAATVGTLGSGNAIPFNFTAVGTPAVAAGRYQTIYSASELGAIPPGSLIREIRVHGSVATLPVSFQGFELRLGYTNIAPTSGMTTNFETNYFGSLTTVIGPTNWNVVSHPGIGVSPARYRFLFTTPFVYDGATNLLVDWRYTGRTGTAWTVTTTTIRQRIFHPFSSTAPLATGNDTSGNWAIDFHYEPAPSGTVLVPQALAEGLPVSGTDIPVMSLNAHSLLAARDLNSITFTKTGTVANAAISSMKLVRDNNFNGVVDAADTVLGTNPLSGGGTVTFTGLPLQSVTSVAPVRLLLAAAIPSAVPVLSTLGFQVASAASAVWSGGPDLTFYPAIGTTLTARYSGDLTISQTPPATFASIGAAFDAMELVGIAGPVTLTVMDSATYLADTSYSLGINAAAIPARAAVIGSSPINTITLRAAPGQTPKVQGSATGAVLLGQTATLGLTGRGALNICASWVTVEGIEAFGGPNFGIMIQANVTSGYTFETESVTIRRCNVHDIPDGPGIAFMSTSAGARFATNVVIEHNFVWNCFTNSGCPTVTGVLMLNTGGAISILNPQSASGAVRHNTVLHTSTFGTASTTACTAGIYFHTNSTSFAVNELNNNIVVCTNATTPALFLGNATLNPTVANCNRNYWNGSTFLYRASVVVVFATWNAEGRDLQGSTNNPQLVSTVVPINLHLLSTSPCKDPVGQTSTAIIDIDGDVRPFGTLADIGADEFVTAGAVLTVGASAGTGQTGFAGATGPGSNGILGATFTISSNATAPGPTLTSISIQASGTGIDTTGYTMADLYRDTNNNGTFEFGTDTLIGVTAANFGTDNGTRVIAVQAAEQVFGVSETRRYFIIVKFSTSVVQGQTFLYRVSAMAVDVASFSAGVPSVIMNGFTIAGPVLTAVAVPGVAQTVLTSELGAGGNGIRVGTFTVSNNAVAATTLTSLTISASGTANEVTTMTQVALYEDTNFTGGWEFGTDTLIGSFTNFTLNNGTCVFSTAPVWTFAPLQARRFFLAVKLGAVTPATDLETYNFTCSALTVPTGTTAVVAPVVTMLGLIVQGPVLTPIPVVPAVAQTVVATSLGAGSNGIHAATFRISNNAINIASLTGITVTASGTGNDLTAYTSLQVFEDVNANDTFDFGVDTQFGATAVPAFSADNGTRAFTILAPGLSFAVSQIRTFLFVVKLNGGGGTTLAINGQTFNFALSTILTCPAGTRGASSATIMTGLVIQGPLLTAAPANPNPPAISVLPTETGPGGNGFAAGSFTFTNDAFGPASLASITIAASGTGIDSTAYSYLAIYEDADNNAVFDSVLDTLFGAAVTVAPIFTLDNGTRLFTAVTPTPFAALQARRFFAVVKMNGTTLATNAQTFILTVSLSTGGNGSATIGTALMNGMVINGPLLTATVVPGTAVPVLTTETGPGTNGFLAQSFTIANTNSLNATLNSLTLTSSGTGNDAVGLTYTYMALFLDTNNNGTFEFGTDTQFGATLTGFLADNTTALFTAVTPVVFTPAQTQRVLIVAKLNGPTIATNGMTFNYALTGMTVTLPTVIATLPSATIMNGISIVGPTASFTSGAGVTQTPYAHETGPGGNGIVVNSFTLGNTNSTIANFASLSITAAGTLPDMTAFTQVGLFQDINSNGTYEFGTDVAYGTPATAFPAENGVLTFTQAGTIAIGGSVRYFLVVKLNGTPLAGPGLTFTFTVGAVVTFPTIAVGLPSAAQNGLTTATPTFAITDDALPQVTAYRGLGDYVLQEFTVGYAAGPANSLGSITITSGGTGNSATGYSAVKLFLDSNTNGTFEPASDTLIQSLAGFTAGTAVFTISGASALYSATDTRRFFVVGDFNNTPLHNTTFQTRVSAGVVGYTGTTFTPALPVPVGFTAGALVVLPEFAFADNSNPLMLNAFMGDAGFTLQSFTVTYPSGPINDMGTITVASSGTGDDVAAYSSVHLVLDDPLGPVPGGYDALDTVVDSVPSFTFDNGPATFTLTGPAATFAALDVKQFFVVVDYSQNGINATSFASAVTGAQAVSFGATNSGLPTLVSAGLNLLDANLQTAFIGPGIAQSVNTDSQGVNNEGNLLCEFTFATGPGGGWTISTLTFVGAGTANHATAYSDLWLYEDDGNGLWDGPAIDSPAASPQVSFAPVTFNATFDMLNPDTAVNTTRRFYLRGRLAGTATSGQTLNARLESMGATPQVGGSVRGLPMVNSTSMIIETTALTVLSGPGTPADLLRKSGSAFAHPILNVRMGATNNNVTVNGITFSNAGTGDFAASLAADGFQVWLDDGDGIFTAADSLLFQGPGAASVTATFSTPVTVPNAGTRDLWVVLNFLDIAAAGAAVPESFQTVINAPGSVNAVGGAQVLLGTPAPQSNVARLVDFFVSSFDPVADLPSGGRDITITGSGFMSPIIVMIDGVVCPGAAVINGAGTQVTGITVPPGTGLDVAITIKSGGLPAEDLTQTFDYVPLAPVKPAPNDGCVVGGSAPAMWWLMVAGLPVVAALRRRRKA